MGRKPLVDDPERPKRVTFSNGSWFYIHRSGKWENLGKDRDRAFGRGHQINDTAGLYGTMAWYLAEFIRHCEERVRAGTLAQRTLDDYRDNTGFLDAYFGRMLPTDIRPSHVSRYLEINATKGRSVRANRERACLSACLSWMARSGKGDVVVNPAMRASGVRRNTESARDRYVTDAEYRAVYDRAPRQVQLLMELTYRTLQRPDSDIIHWTGAVIRSRGDEGRVLSFRQGKTRMRMEIALSGDLEKLIDDAMGAHPVISQPIVHRLDGEAYTYDGLSAMLKRAIVKAKAEVKALAQMEPFGFRDLKGKGATDMWRHGVPIEQIQHLCGHRSKTTTERYVKQRWRETAAANTLKIA
jgi:integrase